MLDRQKNFTIFWMVIGGIFLGVVSYFEETPLHPLTLASLLVIQGYLMGMAILFAVSLQQLPFLAEHLDPDSIQARLDELDEGPSFSDDDPGIVRF